MTGLNFPFQRHLRTFERRANHQPCRQTRSITGLAWCLMAAIVGLSLSANGAPARENVVASIKPVHSLVSAIMQGVAEPHLIVRSADSPHTYSLRPSDATALQNAALVFWVGPGLETFLAKPIKTLARKAKTVELAEAPGLTLLKVREGGAWEAHHHHGEEGADSDHDDKDGEEHHEGHAGDTHMGDTHMGDAHAGVNMHVWLDPKNAIAMAKAISQALQKTDAAHAGIYARNTRKLIDRLQKLETEIAATLSPVRARPFLVFHDAYQYLEHRFGLNAIGSVTINPESTPSAKRIVEVRAKIRKLAGVCVFAEPQFSAALVKSIVKGTNARTATLDPIGAGLEPGPDLYFKLMLGNARALKKCLSPTG